MKMVHVTVLNLWNSESCRAKAEHPYREKNFLKDENGWVCLKGYLQTEFAGAWQVKARKILLYYRAEHDKEKRVEEGMQALTK